MGLSEFHFLRPDWLLLLPIVIGFGIYLLFRQPSRQPQLNTLLPPEFQHYLLVGTPSTSHNRWRKASAFVCALLSIIALAGPAWQQLPQPVEQKRDGLVIVLDLSYSMLATDLQPDRFTRARYKITDFIKQRKEGLTGLVVYAGSAHVVTPLTDDTRTIISLTEALDPKIAPIPGSESQAGIRKAVEMLQNSALDTGNILLITDGIEENEVGFIRRILAPLNYRLSILGVGTLEGAPIPTPKGQLRNQQNRIIIPKLPEQRLQTMAQSLKGVYTRISISDNDIDLLHNTMNQATLASALDNLQNTDDPSSSTHTDQTHQSEFDQWQDEGHWLLLPIILLSLFAFRRGVIFSIMPMLLPSTTLIVLLSGLSIQAEAATNAVSEMGQPQDLTHNKAPSNSLWKTPDQQGQQFFDQQDYSQAAQHYKSLEHRAAAFYKMKDYDSALSDYYAQLELKGNELTAEKKADLHYNIGNTLAHLQRWDESITAYDTSLEWNNHHEDARHNRNIVQNLKNKAEQNQEKSQENSQKNSQEQSDPSSEENAEQQNPSSDSSSENNEGSPKPSDENQEQTKEGSAAQQEENPNTPSQANTPEKSNQEEGNQDENQESSASSDNVQEQETTSEETSQTPSSSSSQAIQKRNQAYIDRWLQQLPDQPGNLLKNKFQLETMREQRARQKGQTTNKELRQNPEIYW